MRFFGNTSFFLFFFFFHLLLVESKLFSLLVDMKLAVVHKFSPFSSHSFARLPLWTCRNYMVFESDVNATGNTRSCSIVPDVEGNFSAVSADHRARSFRGRETEWRSIGVEWRASPFSRCSLVRHRSWRRSPQVLVAARLFDGSNWTRGINALTLTFSIFRNNARWSVYYIARVILWVYLLTETIEIREIAIGFRNRKITWL